MFRAPLIWRDQGHLHIPAQLHSVTLSSSFAQYTVMMRTYRHVLSSNDPFSCYVWDRAAKYFPRFPYTWRRYPAYSQSFCLAKLSERVYSKRLNVTPLSYAVPACRARLTSLNLQIGSCYVEAFQRSPWFAFGSSHFHEIWSRRGYSHRALVGAVTQIGKGVGCSQCGYQVLVFP